LNARRFVGLTKLGPLRLQFIAGLVFFFNACGKCIRAYLNAPATAAKN
jgi:hypothetical protein